MGAIELSITRPARKRLRRDAALIALTMLTGATDALAFVNLGEVFTSVMTGNMVLMGIGVGRAEINAVTHVLVAIGGYILGAIVGGVVAGEPRPDDRPWPRVVTWCLLTESGLYILYSTLWWSAGSNPSAMVVLSQLCILAMALGLQSSAVLRLGMTGFSTTYLTGTLTQVTSTLAAHRSVRGIERAIACLLALVVGAVLGATVAHWHPGLGPVVPLLLVGAALALVTLPGGPADRTEEPAVLSQPVG